MDAYPATNLAAYDKPAIVQKVDVKRIRGENTLERMIAQASPRTERISVNEYYQNAKPSPLMPGLKEQDFGYGSVSTGGFTFFGTEWGQYYVDNKDGKGTKMQEIFRSLDGKPINMNGVTYTFDFGKFNEYWAAKKNNIRDVSFRGEFLTWRDIESQKVYAMPIPKEVGEKVKGIGWK